MIILSLLLNIELTNVCRNWKLYKEDLPSYVFHCHENFGGSYLGCESHLCHHAFFIALPSGKTCSRELSLCPTFSMCLLKNPSNFSSKGDVEKKKSLIPHRSSRTNIAGLYTQVNALDSSCDK